MERDHPILQDVAVIGTFVAAPSVWALHLGLSYWFVPVSCDHGTALPMHLTTLGAVVALAATLVVARTTTHWQLSGARGVMARMALLMSVYFLGVVVMTGLVAVVMRPCA